MIPPRCAASPWRGQRFSSGEAGYGRCIAFATFVHPICLFLLAAASETGMLPIRENLAGGAGMIVMLLLVTQLLWRCSSPAAA